MVSGVSGVFVVAHISDLHFDGSEYHRSRVEAVLHYINARADGIDALVHADIAGDARRGARDGDMEVECEPVGGRSGFNSSQKCLKECFLVQNIGAV